jgi:D-aminoacyl-tRNA deacylase
MRAVVQRVSHVSVAIAGTITARIGPGLLVFVGFEPGDDLTDLDWLASKLVNLRIFADENGLMNRSILDVNGGVLVVSQFTLFASTKKGNRPSYLRSAKPEVAGPLYCKFIECVTSELGRPIQTGTFGADMQIELLNDGPVTIVIDTKARE